MVKSILSLIYLAQIAESQEPQQGPPIIFRHDRVETPRPHPGPIQHFKNIFRNHHKRTSTEVMELPSPATPHRLRASSFMNLTPQGKTFKNKWLIRKLHLNKFLTSEERNYLISIHENTERNPVLWQKTYDYKVLTAWQEYEYKRTRGIAALDDYMSGQFSMDDLINSTYDKMITGTELSIIETDHVKETGKHVQADPFGLLGSLDLKVWNMWVQKS